MSRSSRKHGPLCDHHAALRSYVVELLSGRVTSCDSDIAKHKLETVIAFELD